MHDPLFCRIRIWNVLTGSESYTTNISSAKVRVPTVGIFLVSTECHERVSLKKTILDNDGFRSFFQISDPEEFFNRSRIGKYILAFGISRILAISDPSETA